MKKKFTAGLMAGILMLALAGVSFAHVFVDGSGTMPPELLYLENYANSFQYNTPSPGIMYQNTLNHPGGVIGPGAAMIELTEDTAVAELNHAKGWFFETKVNAIQNVDGPNYAWIENLGVSVYFEDDFGGAELAILPDRIYVIDNQSNNLGTYTHNTPGYHTIRVEVGPNSPSALLYVDGIHRLSFNLDTELHQRVLYFGDGSSGSDGEAYWDYFAVNAEYKIIDLGTLGGSLSHGRDINQSGQVAGLSTSTAGNSTQHAFFWGDQNHNGINDAGEMNILGSPSDESWGYGVNDFGQVVGQYHVSGQPINKPFVWDSISGLRVLDTLGGTQGSSWAYDINNNRLAVGVSRTITNDIRATCWDTANNRIIDLGTLGPSQNLHESYATDINESGQVVGSSFYEPGVEMYHAFIWNDNNSNTISDHGEMLDINDSTLGGNSVAYGVNDNGQVVGAIDSIVDNQRKAFIWHENTMQLINTLGGNESNAQGINNLGQVVGQSLTTADVMHAFIWDENKGMRDLNDLIPVNSGWELTFGYEINDAGKITGIGVVDDEEHAFLLIPIGPNADADVDGILDSWETATGLNPNDPSDAAQDLDGDGLANLAEYLAGTAPNNPDTDGDGVYDGFDGYPLDDQRGACLNLIRINGPTHHDTFTTIQAAVDDLNAIDYDAIQITAADFEEDVLYSRDEILTLSGGYYCDFSDNPSTSSFNSLTIRNGTIIVEKVIIKDVPGQSL